MMFFWNKLLQGHVMNCAAELVDWILHSLASSSSSSSSRAREGAKNVHGRVIQGTKAALCRQALELK